MKLTQKLLQTSLVLTALLLNIIAAYSVTTTPAAVAAELNRKEKIACVDKYDGHGRGAKTDNKFTGDLKKAYDKSKCDKDKGGNCDIVQRDDVTESIIVRCEDPRATGTTPGADGCVECDTGTDYDANDCSAGSFDSLSGDNCGILKYILLITNVLSGLAATVIVAMMIVGGIQYSMAGADPSKVQAAKQKIINALIALVLFVFGFALVQWLVPGGLF